MRHTLNLSIILFAMSMFLNACFKDRFTEHYSFYRPVYMTKGEVRASARSSAPLAVSHPGKLFIKGNHIFLNEVDKGIHIIDFSIPSSPKNIAFIKIPGCVDMAVRGNFLYADCYTDLVTIDISDPTKAVVKQFIEGVFPHRAYAWGFRADTSLIITAWKRVDTVVRSSVSWSPGSLGGVLMADNRGLSSFASASSPGVQNGTGGSMARFGLMDDRLYTVSWNDLKVFNTSNPSLPTFVKTLQFDQGDIETIFPYKDRLFIGSQSGMFIYDAANRDNPVKLGQFTHARACDPVVADDTHAYVTLRSNSRCTGVTNQLDVIDINTLSKPKLLKTYSLREPAGLSKDGNLLFICDGKDGLKIYDATRPDNLIRLQTVGGMETYDVIAFNKMAITVATDGLYIIDYSVPSQAKVTGKITLEKP
jgi:hypothetical protein